MNTQMQIFFIISSIGFVILWILAAIFLYYLVLAMATFHRIMSKIENDINHIGDTTREFLGTLSESMIWNFIFGKKKKRTHHES